MQIKGRLLIARRRSKRFALAVSAVSLTACGLLVTNGEVLSASAAVANYTYNVNSCGTYVTSSSTIPTTVAVGLGSDQSQAALQNTITDATTSPPTLSPGGIDGASSAANTFQSQHLLTPGESSSLTNTTLDVVMDPTDVNSFLGATGGVSGSGNSLEFRLDITINNGTFDSSQPSTANATISQINPETLQVVLINLPSPNMSPGSSWDSGPLPIPNLNFTAANTTGTTVSFAESYLGMSMVVFPLGSLTAHESSCAIPQAPVYIFAALTIPTPTTTPPAVTTQPSSQSVLTGNSLTFTAGASGTPTPTAQWQLSVDGGSTWFNIAGATSTTYTTGLLNPFVSGWQVRAVFTNSAGSATTNGATITVTPSTSVVIPSNGATISGSTFFDAGASAGVTSVVYELTGGSLSNAVIATATPTIYGWLASWNST